MFPAQHRRWLTVVTVSAALFLITIDGTILYTALPTLTQVLHASEAQKLWIVNAYPLVVAGLLPCTGPLGDRLGHRRMFVVGLVIFGLASSAAAFASTPAQLIAARVALALGGATMMPSTLAIIRDTFDNARERSLALGVWASIASGGAAAGPVIGGALLEHFYWGAVFLVNVPLVALTLLLTTLIARSRPARGTPQPWNIVPSLQAMAGLVCLVYAIKQLAHAGSPWLTTLLAGSAGVALLWHFVRRQLASATPLIDFRLMHCARFRTGMLTIWIATLALVGFELVAAQYLQLVLEFRPLHAGLFLMPLALAALLMGPVCGLLLPRVGMRTLIISGLAAMAAGFTLLALVPFDSAGAIALPALLALVLIGAGFNAAATAASATVMAQAPGGRTGMAASMEEVSYELGGVVGVTVFGSVVSMLYASGMAAGSGDSAYVALNASGGAALPAQARASVDYALALSSQLSGDAAALLAQSARAAFGTAFYATLWGAAALMLFSAASTAFALRTRRPVIDTSAARASAGLPSDR